MNAVVHSSFVAIDFETADELRDSACSVGMVRVDDGRITERVHRLIRPPRNAFRYSQIHGIEWSEVEDQPPFSVVWPGLECILEGASVLVAHNAAFDRSVLHCCIRSANLNPPAIPFECTMKISRRIWHIFPTTLPYVCQYLGIELQHQNALSDAEACARIMIAATREIRVRG